MVNRVFLWTLRVLVRWRQIAERRGNKTPSWAVAKQLATNIYVRTSTFLESTRFRFSFTFLAKFVGKKFLSNDERSRARIKAIHIEEEKFAFDIRFVRLIAHILMNKAFRNDSVYRVFRGRTRNFPDTACLVRETIRSNPIESDRIQPCVWPISHFEPPNCRNSSSVPTVDSQSISKRRRRSFIWY